MKKHLLFLGAPGAGKGTQAELLSQTNSYLHLSTGELLRKEIEMNSILGIQVKDIMNRGELVSDELVLKIVRQNLDKNNKGLGATSLLILVGVAIDTAKQIQTYVISQRYEGLINN